MASAINTTTQLIVDTAAKIFADGCDKQVLDAAERGEFPQQLWQTIVEHGFHQIGCADSGTDATDLFAFLQVCGRYAVPLPMASVLLANRWCGATDEKSAIGLLLQNTIVKAPWGREAQRVVGVAQDSTEVKVGRGLELRNEEVSIAGEPQDQVASVTYETLQVEPNPYAQMALANVNLIAGCLQTQLDLGVLFATQRIQFGRPISKFQAIQHSLAVIAAEVAAAKRAADAAVDALEDSRFVAEVAASKARVGEAVGYVAEQVHQIHGAMGFTHEHRLHHFSRRSWAWRDEWGNEFYWQRQLGETLCQVGADQVWDFIATQS